MPRIPGPEADLARPRSRWGHDQQGLPVRKGTRRPVTVPEPDPEWHPIALMIWQSLAGSGQADFYQQSDWAYAYSVCEELSVYKYPNVDRNGVEYVKRSGQMLQVIDSALARLLVTEADRRKLRIELDEDQGDETPASVAIIADYKRSLGYEDTSLPPSH